MKAEPSVNQPRVLVLLCTYNERHNLPQVLAALWDALPASDVLVIDDNSPDGTGKWAVEHQAHEPRLHVVVRRGKLGLGSALRNGMTWCIERRYDFLLNMDADQSHDPRMALRLLEPCAASGTGRHVALGSRYVDGGATVGLSALRHGLSRLLNWYATALLHLPVHDCSGSYRCYPVSLLCQLNLQRLTCNGYGFLEEVLVHLARAGAAFIEVPITYHSRGSGSSKLSLADAWGVLVVIHRLAFTQVNLPPPGERAKR